jgi:lysophospholipase L1-like esterase
MKIMILTDSLANPRTIPIADSVNLEDTYPYILKKELTNSTFWQLSLGSAYLEVLVNQAIGYLLSWEPEYIIIQSGINESKNIAKNSWIGFYKKNSFAVDLVAFKKNLKKIKYLFPKSVIIYIGISTSNGYAEKYSSVAKRVVEFNQAIKSIVGDDFIETENRLREINGFNQDGIHLNKVGHELIARLIFERLNFK